MKNNNTHFNNPEIRQALLENPKLALKTYFEAQADQVDVKVVENTKTISYVVIPAADYATNTNDLSSITAAGSVSTIGTVGSAASVATACSSVSTISSAGTAGSGGCAT